MTVRIVRLGTDRIEGEGLRIGTVRRPPRGVKKEDYGKLNWYDTWLPNLSPWEKGTHLFFSNNFIVRERPLLTSCSKTLSMKEAVRPFECRRSLK